MECNNTETTNGEVLLNGLIDLSKYVLEMGIDKFNIQDNKSVKIIIFSISYYYNLYKDEKCLSVLEYISRDESVDIEIRVFLYWQLLRAKFMNIDKLDDINLLQVYDGIFKKVQEGIELIKYKDKYKEDKDKNSVVLITNQFLGYEHAPTKVLMNIAKAINDNYKQIDNIYIYNSTEMPTKTCCKFYKPLLIANYIELNEEDLDEIIKIAGIDRCKIYYNQNPKESSIIARIEPMLKEIYELKPSFIISIGGSNILADLCNNFIDVYTYGTIRGIPIAKTKYLVNLVNDKCITETQINKNQYFIGIPQGVYGLENKYDESYTRKEFGIPDEMFLISVVGVRLDIEITDDFMNMCKKILIANKNAGIILLGGYNKESIKYKVPKDVYDRIYSVGFKRNLLAALSLTDMFLNPVRTGGGYSGVYAMMCNIPILSINYGDVAAILTDDFKVKDYHEMSSITNKIIKNPKVYDEMSNKMKSIHEEYKKIGWNVLIDYILNKSKEQ